MSALFTRTYTFVDGTVAYGSQVESEVGNIVTVLNSLNAATTNWGQVSVLHATSVPLVADCSSGSQHIADFKNNSVIKASVDSTGKVTGTALTAGASGTAGTLDIFPTTASKGKLEIVAADSAGDTTTIITNASQAGARTYTIPDQGASSKFLLSAVALVDNARVNAAGYIIGSVVQTQTGTRTTATTTTSATYVTANLSASITPKATTHKIRVSVSGSIVNTAGSSVFYTIKRGSTDLDATGNGFGSTGSATISITTTCSTVILDAPATTSATTYEVFIRNNSAGATVTWNNNAFTSYMLLEEIAF